MSRRILIAIIAAAAMICACGPRLVIVHANDTHSHLDPERIGRNAGHGGIVERAAIIDSIRTKYGRDKVLVLHAGDFNQGTTYFSELGGNLEIELVNAIGYDCICLGNHEMDNGLEDLASRLARINCDVICANCDFSSLPLGRYVKPYTVIERGGMKIGFVGLISDIKSVVSKPISDRIPLLDNVEVTNKWAKYLKTELGCDFVILLSHIGWKEDAELIKKSSNIDLVVGGHSHTFVDEMKYVTDSEGKTVPIVTDGCNGVELGEIKVY